MIAACGASGPRSGSPSAHGSQTGSAKASLSGGGAPAGQRRSGVELNGSKKIDWAKVPSSSPTQSGVVRIAYRDIAIIPDAVRVKLGSTIRWTNYDSVPHNVTSEGGPLRFSSGDFGEGKSYEIKASRLGVIHYECTLEPTTMNGTIEVVR